VRKDGGVTTPRPVLGPSIAGAFTDKVRVRLGQSPSAFARNQMICLQALSLQSTSLDLYLYWPKFFIQAESL